MSPAFEASLAGLIAVSTTARVIVVKAGGDREKEGGARFLELLLMTLNSKVETNQRQHVGTEGSGG